MTSDAFFCPRSEENGGGPNSPFKPPFNGEAHWRDDGTCSFCGSMNPDAFMSRLEAGDVTLEPTDKDYKVYVIGAGRGGRGKFYFQHLSDAQRTRFVELLNAKKIGLEYPGHFYVTPFFCRPLDPSEKACL